MRYVRKSGAPTLFVALGADADRCTATARDLVVRCAALRRSFVEGRGLLKRLNGMDLSASKSRAVALALGAQCLRRQEQAAPRILVVRRCKQAGMHWRHRIAAILAYFRSAA